jgi:hypothetical protein
LKTVGRDGSTRVGSVHPRLALVSDLPFARNRVAPAAERGAMPPPIAHRDEGRSSSTLACSTGATRAVEVHEALGDLGSSATLRTPTTRIGPAPAEQSGGSPWAGGVRGLAPAPEPVIVVRHGEAGLRRDLAQRSREVRALDAQLRAAREERWAAAEAAGRGARRRWWEPVAAFALGVTAAVLGGDDAFALGLAAASCVAAGVSALVVALGPTAPREARR